MKTKFSLIFPDDLDSTSAETHILMAQIYLHEKNYQQGAQSLEVGLSYNFKIREHPLYHLIHAMVHKENGNIEDCIHSLKSAMTASGLRDSVNQPKGKQNDFQFSVSDKAMLYLELINAYQLNNNLHEVSKLMDEALEQFRGKSFTFIIVN